MRRDELTELQFITPLANIPSIRANGILSNRRAKPLGPVSISKPEVQDLRAKVKVPGGRALHEYANLYFHARNPMLFLRRDIHQTLCVLRISDAVVDLPGVIVTDQNAASGHARFLPTPGGLAIVDKERVYAEYWNHPDDQIASWRHKSTKCAEVLVPDRVDAGLLVGAYVSCESARATLAAMAPQLPIKVDAHFFFVG